MAQSDLPALLARTTGVLARLAIPDQPVLRQVGAFLSGPPVVAISGSRARGLDELTEGLKMAFSSVTFRTDLKEAELEGALVDAMVVATPCEAALSAMEVQTIRALRQSRRPVTVVVTDAEQLGDGRAAGQAEIESLRLRPLLGPEDVTWCFRARGEPFEASSDLVRKLVEPGASRLHGKPAADALARILGQAHDAYDERCRVRDQEREVLRNAEAQGPLDLAQFSETEKVERLRVGDRIRASFERVLAAADATGAALAAWVRADGKGDAKDATSTIEEAWNAFCRDIEEAPRASMEAVQAEGRRLASRLRDTATRLNAPLAPAFPPGVSLTLSLELADAGRRLAETSIRDLIDGAIKIMKAAGAEAAAKPKDVSRVKNPKEQSGRSKARNPSGKLDNVARWAMGAIPPPLTPAERVRGHLVQGIRSRIDLRLRAYVEGIEEWFRVQAEPRVGAWSHSRAEAMKLIRMTLSERHAWSSALGELEVLRHEVEEFRRTLA